MFYITSMNTCALGHYSIVLLPFSIFVEWSGLIVSGQMSLKCWRVCECMDTCNLRPTMSRAFALATYAIFLQARPLQSDCSSSLISSCCRSESAARPAQCSRTADIHILPCTVSMCAGAGWVGWCNLSGLDVLWRFCWGTGGHCATMDTLFIRYIFLWLYGYVCMTSLAVKQ